MSTGSRLSSPLRTLRRARLELKRWIAKRRKTRKYVPIYTLWRSWCDEVTLGGKWLIGALIVSGVGTVTMQLPVYQIFCALVALTLVGLAGGFFSIPIVKVSGAMPSRVVAGEPVSMELNIRNRSRWRTIFDVGIGIFDLPASIKQRGRGTVIASLEKQASHTLPVTLVPGRRGLFELPPFRAFTTFPFNLFRIGMPARGDRHPLLVLPTFHPLESVSVPTTMRYQPGGIALTSNIGESPEYIGNREYVPGEPIRRLDARSWARLGRPVVREYQEEFYCRVGLIVDTFVAKQRQQPADGYPDLEAAISMTAAVADGLSNGEYLIDIFAAGDELHVFRAGRHTAHLENILEILACVEPSYKDAFSDVSAAIVHELESISTAICVFIEWNDQRRELVRQIQEAGCALKILMVAENAEKMSIDVDADVEFMTPEQIRNGGVVSV
jgi:uncharacterized protein (DUF58 family)